MLHTLGNPIELWCGYGPCPSVAASNGAKGSTLEEAHANLCRLVEQEREQNDWTKDEPDAVCRDGNPADCGD